MILCVALVVIGNIITLLFVFNWHILLITYIIWAIINNFDTGLIIIGLHNGFTGKAKELPLIGKFRIIKQI